ncbi:MAG: hypothetical protein H7Z72_00150 [Bacteroidetes bacterium]|nr:hypothetical protein [Fibrella sp.]
MKRLLYSVCLLALTLACESDIFPTGLLYQRWQLERTRQGDAPWAVYNLIQNDTEYRLDGTLVYRVKGQIVVPCCPPNRFSRDQNEITFVNSDTCPFSLCAGPTTNKSTITQLTDDLLELKTGEIISQYRAVK